MRILIWGTGFLSEKFINNGYNGEIIGFIQTKKKEDFFMEKPVYTPDSIKVEYDYIIVANSYTAEIYEVCREYCIDINKVIFLYYYKKHIGFNDINVIEDILGERNYIEYCKEYGMYDKTFFERDLLEYQSSNKRKNFDVNNGNIWPIITEKYAAAGTVHNYFWQDLWAAKLINLSGVKRHFDIGSRLDGFIAHLLSNEIDVTMIDVREFPVQIEGLHTIVDDATYLSQIQDDSISSMSALCSLEHFGLGRYGDPVDPEACFKCFDSIQNKLAPNGKLYISLPIGRERVEFNAHRIFYPSTIIEHFSKMKLLEFSCTSQDGIEYNVDIHKYDDDPHNGEFRYGLFCFEKNI